MDSTTLAERLGARVAGQMRLWEDDDLVLRSTPFRSVDPEFDREALVHWWMHVLVPDGRGDDKTECETWKSWERAMRTRFDYVRIQGYNPTTHQSALKITFAKSDPLGPQLAELEMWVPHVKDSPGDRKAIRISEHTLAQYGYYHLVVYPAGCTIERTTYGHTRVVEEFPGIEPAAEFIRRELWS